MNKPSTLKRVVAYFIDLIVVTLISGIITLVFINNEQYESDSRELLELTKGMAENKIEREDYLKQFDNLNYKLTKDSIEVTIISCSVSVVYFVVMCYLCHGITLGKYFMKIRIVSANEKELNIFNYFFRSLLINMILSNLLTIILINALSKETFLSIYSRISNMLTLLMLVSFIFIMYRHDGRGIEDFMGNTKVIDIKKELLQNEEKNTDKEVAEAQVVKEDKKTTKKNSKKKDVK